MATVVYVASRLLGSQTTPRKFQKVGALVPERRVIPREDHFQDACFAFLRRLSDLYHPLGEKLVCLREELQDGRSVGRTAGDVIRWVVRINN